MEKRKINPKNQVGKKASMDDLTSKVQKAKSFVLFEYQGLSAPDLAVARKTLKSQGGEIKVYKNSLASIALRDLKIDSKVDSMLTGSIAFAFSYGDEIASAKVVEELATAKNLKIKGGVFEGKVIGTNEVITLSKIPGREGLYSMFLSVVQAPMRNLAYALSQIAQKQG